LGETLLIVASPSGKRFFDGASKGESLKRTTSWSEENTASGDRMHIWLGEDSSGEGVKARLCVTGKECGVTTRTSLSFVGFSVVILEEQDHNSEEK
jgi:hypothetical protein